MSLFQRISATFSASVDNLVDRVENHDAVVEASIRKCRQAAADTRVKLARLQKDGERLRARIQTLENEITNWQQRAIDCADEDESKALQCLKRKKNLQDELERTGSLLASHRQSEQQVRSNLQQIESRIDDITQQRNAMRTRESAARAMRILNQMEGSNCVTLDDTFDRWESSLVETEMVAAAFSPTDELADEFVQQEEEQALRDQLTALKDAQREAGND